MGPVLQALARWVQALAVQPARFGASAQATEWDARYSEREGAKWSGRPNGRLQAEVAGLTPGRALDVGCGEGRFCRMLKRHAIRDSIRGKMIRCMMNTEFLTEVLTLQ